MPEVRHSVCALDCPDCCSLLVTVENGRAEKLRGNPEHPITQGFLCAKVSRYLEREYSPQRLLYPRKRAGGGFERISWDEALDAVAGRLQAIAREFGPEAILPYSYAGTMGYLNGSGMDRRFFHRLGASRLERTICSKAGTAGLIATLGAKLGMDTEDFSRAKLIIAWGANVLGTNVHLWPFVVAARRNGAKFYVIDPVRHKTASLADKFFGIYPGSDLALALGLAHVIIGEKLHDRDYLRTAARDFDSLAALAAQYPPERVEVLTGIAREDIVELARVYATTRPAAIRLNYGVQRSERGGAAVRAIAMLPALVGAWKETGGGLQLTTSGAFQVNDAALERPDLQPRPTRQVNMTELGKALTELQDPPVKALVVYNSNPAAIAPNQSLVLAGLRRPDLFKVVIEHFQTDTADHADILLPATTFLEHTDLYMAYGHFYLQLARPALPAPGETKSNVEIFRLLAARMGFDDACFRDTEDDMIRALLATGSPFLRGISLERLEREHFVKLNVAKPYAPVSNLSAEGLEYAPPVESRRGDAALRERYPLELVSSKNEDSLNSTFGYRDAVDEQTSILWMHAEDAGARGIGSGDPVRVFNGRGSCLMAARTGDGVRPGVVRAPSVRWNKRSPGGAGINVLTSDRLTDLGGGPTFYSCLVQVEKCGD